ncbi:MAG: Na+/H+ antiporter subunit D [Firmicutes bacterium]|nr:Na+/H+ antiporter subunit D [Bacillota bacterium]
MADADLVIAPVLWPLLTGIVLALTRRDRARQRRLSVISVLVGLLLALVLMGRVSGGHILVFRAGDWPAPFGIVLVADRLSALMVALTYVVAIPGLWQSLQVIPPELERRSYYALFQLLLMGINGAFLTGDIFNMFVWFEVLLIASYALVPILNRGYPLQEGFKYMVFNMVASTLFVVAVAVLYGVMGTLNLADLAVRAAQMEDPRLLTVIAMLFAVVFAAKAALFPLYFWLPGGYDAAPTPLSGVFAGLLTKVGMYALIRAFSLVFPLDPDFTRRLVLVIAALTMSIGVLGAVAQVTMKRILAYHSISQVGYMAMGLGLDTPLALAGAVYFMIHHSVIKSALFFVTGATEHVTGTESLKQLGGLARPYPALAAVFLVAALSLAGIPPLSGFFGKLVLAQAGLAVGELAVVAVSIAVSFFTLFSMMKIQVGVFWGPLRQPDRPARAGAVGRLLLPAAALVLVSVGLGIGAHGALGLMQQAAAQLVDPAAYIEAVLAPGGRV